MKIGVVTTLAVGCSDSSDSLSLEEYFAAFEAIDADAAAQFVEASADFPETEDPFAEEASLSFFEDLVAAYERIHRDRLASAADLDPPPEAEDAHNDFVDAQQDLLSVVEEGKEAIQKAETMAEIETLLSEPSIFVAATAFETACFALADIADENDIAVAITCAVDG